MSQHPVQEVVGIPEFEYPDHNTHRDAIHVVRWSGINFDFPVPLIQRRDLQPGDVIQSSHGYKLYVTRIKFRCTTNADQALWLEGGLHGDPEGINRPENSPAISWVPLLSRGGVTFGVGDDVPRVPVPRHELTGRHLDADGRVIDRKLRLETV